MRRKNRGKSRIENRESRIGNRESRIGNRESGMVNGEPAALFPLSLPFALRSVSPLFSSEPLLIFNHLQAQLPSNSFIFISLQGFVRVLFGIPSGFLRVSLGRTRTIPEQHPNKTRTNPEQDREKLSTRALWGTGATLEGGRRGAAGLL